MVIKTVMNFSTSDLLPRDQFDAWRSVMAPVIDLELVGQKSKGFDAELDVWNLGGMTLTRAIMPGAFPPRRWRHLTRDPMDHWCLVLAHASDPATTGSYPGKRYLGFRSLARPFEGFAE